MEEIVGLGNYLSFKEALSYLDLNGVNVTEGNLWMLLSLGKIKSKKIFNSKLIEKDSVNKYIAKRKSESR